MKLLRVLLHLFLSQEPGIRRCAAALALGTAFLCPGVRADIFHIDSVKINAPIIRQDSLIYTLDMYFLDRPGSFWSYYDQTTGSITIEFIDAQIFAPQVTFPKGMPFLGFRVRNAESGMALTKEVSHVSVTVDKGPRGDQFWNNDVRLVNNSVVRVVIWKEKIIQENAAAKDLPNDCRHGWRLASSGMCGSCVLPFIVPRSRRPFPALARPRYIM